VIAITRHSRAVLPLVGLSEISTDAVDKPVDKSEVTQIKGQIAMVDHWLLKD
jgi:hypothetical protein